MEIKILKEMYNPFFKRKDIQLKIIHTGASTPRKDDLKKELAKMYKVDELQVAVDYILTKRGLGESVARAKILDEKLVVVEKSAKPESEDGNEGGEIEAQASKAE